MSRVVYKRLKAKKIIAEHQLIQLSVAERRSILEEYWHFESKQDMLDQISEGELPELSDQLIDGIISMDKPKAVNDQQYDVLVMDWLVFKLLKSSNAYLTIRLNGLGHCVTVEGPPDPASGCPCCGYLSIDEGEEGLWDICPVCYWENGGDGPNHMSLRGAQNNFKILGAKNVKSLEYVDPEGIEKYEKAKK